MNSGMSQPNQSGYGKKKLSVRAKESIEQRSGERRPAKLKDLAKKDSGLRK